MLTLSGVWFSSQGSYFCYFSCLQPSLDGVAEPGFRCEEWVLWNSHMLVQPNFHFQITVTWYPLSLGLQTQAQCLIFPKVDILRDVHLLLQIKVTIVVSICWLCALARHSFKNIICISWILTTLKTGTTINPIYRWENETRGGKWLSQGHTAMKWQNLDLNSSMTSKPVSWNPVHFPVPFTFKMH